MQKEHPPPLPPSWREETGARQRHAPGVERGREQSSDKAGGDPGPRYERDMGGAQEEIPEQNKITADAVEKMMERQERERQEGRLRADETLFPL